MNIPNPKETVTVESPFGIKVECDGNCKKCYMITPQPPEGIIGKVGALFNGNGVAPVDSFALEVQEESAKKAGEITNMVGCERRNCTTEVRIVAKGGVILDRNHQPPSLESISLSNLSENSVYP